MAQNSIAEMVIKGSDVAGATSGTTGVGSCNLCMPYWIRDQEGRLVRIENPQDTELDICVNIMDPPQEDQNSQHGQGGNPNAYLSMRDRMHPPRMSARSCIVPPLEQLIIRPHIVPLDSCPIGVSADLCPAGAP
ncbi:hypothetical protein VitviT2T_008537 [Vitis vinifera]|uniref:Uncharacterized protein n=1 Tax=Vitis vinifera TaxID=29760 RepID=A0ABY9C2R9_VITVI|nr:hypothetical protein VitviT2T_008537 [Vitis vinifera]